MVNAWAYYYWRAGRGAWGKVTGPWACCSCPATFAFCLPARDGLVSCWRAKRLPSYRRSPSCDNIPSSGSDSLFLAMGCQRRPLPVARCSAGRGMARKTPAASVYRSSRSVSRSVMACSCGVTCCRVWRLSSSLLSPYLVWRRGGLLSRVTLLRHDGNLAAYGLNRRGVPHHLSI